MNTQGFTAGRASLNVTLDQATEVLNQIVADKISAGKPVALFANETGGGANYMCPVTATQNNGSAKWVDPNQNLTALGIDPAKDQLYFQVWVESKQDYYMVGGIIRELSFGMTIAQCLE